MQPKLSLLILLTVLPVNLCGQTIPEPQYALKTPLTLNIISLEMTSASTIMNLSVENRIDGGYFCANKNSFLVTPDGLRLKLNNSTGIPACPDVYRFKNIGEILYFTLRFPALPANTAWFDLVEECDDNCFSVLGIATDPLLSERITNCYRAIDAGDKKKAIALFEELLPKLEAENHALTGSLYLTIIDLSKEINPALAKEYREKLASSSVPHKEKMKTGN